MGCILELSILEVLLGFPGSEIWEVSVQDVGNRKEGEGRE